MILETRNEGLPVGIDWMNLSTDQLKTERYRLETAINQYSIIEPDSIRRLPRNEAAYIWQLIMAGRQAKKVAEKPKPSVNADQLDLIQEVAERGSELMTVSNFPLVKSRAKLLLNRGIDRDDLEQEGTIGLMRAVEKFDPSRNYQFSTYAWRWIDALMQHAVVRQSQGIQLTAEVDRSVRQMRHRVDQVITIDGSKKDDELRVIFEKEGYKDFEIEAFFRRPLRSLDKVILRNNFNIPFGHTIKDPNLGDNHTEETAIENVLIADLITLLDENEIKVITKHFGLNGVKPVPFSDIASEMGYTRQRTHQIKDEAIRKMRRFLASD